MRLQRDMIKQLSLFHFTSPLMSTHLTFIAFSRLIFNEDSRNGSTPFSGSPTSIAQLVKNCPAMQEPLVQCLAQEGPWRRDRLPTPVFLGFPSQSAGKESACNVGDLGSVPGLGQSPGEGIIYPLQYSWASLLSQLVKNLPAMYVTSI